MTNFTRTLFGVLLSFIINSTAFSQNTGDFRSKQTGNWEDFNTWQIYDGVSWNDATTGQIPGGTSESDADNVYIEAGHTVTLETNHTCKDLHLNTTADIIRLNIQENSLNVWGKLRLYTGTAPGSNSGSGGGGSGFISTGTNGKIILRGSVDRAVTSSGEFGSNTNLVGWNLEFAFDSGITGTFDTNIRCGNLTISSGTWKHGASSAIRVSGSDASVPGNGNVTIKSGAILYCNLSYGIIQNNFTDNGALASIVLESGAELRTDRSALILSAVSVDLSGKVTLMTSGTNQDFPIKGTYASAEDIDTFNELILDGSNSKIQQYNITVTKLTLAGTASLNNNSYTLIYASGGELEYKGSSLQTTSNSEFPTTNGPSKLTINNSNGVKLHADRIISDVLTLTSGLIFLDSYNLTLGENSPSVDGSPSTSNMVVTNGTGELRKIFSSTGSFFYPIGDTTGTEEYSYAQVTINSADVLDATTYVGLRVKDAEHPADDGIAFDNLSRYWRVSSNMTNIDFNSTFQYLTADIIGDEIEINSYYYSNETPLPSRTAISKVNSFFHRIEISSFTSTGFFSGANLCDISNNTITAPVTTEFCGTGTPGLIDGTAATVTSGSPTYQWQQRIDGGAWSDISLNGQSEDYTSPTLASSGVYIFRRVVTDLINCTSSDLNLSNEITITTLPSISGNSIGSDQNITSGGDPAPFTETGTLSEGSGSYSYQWKSSTTQGGPYSTITSETSNTYDIPSGITQTTYYVREVTSGVCTSTSNEITVTIQPTAVLPDISSLVEIYPNPTSEYITVKLENVITSNSHIELTNSVGKKVMEKSFNSSDITLNISDLPAGVYYLVVTTLGGKSEKAIVKK